MGSWGLGHWIIVLIIVLLVFGTKRLTSGARDIGKAVNEFKKGVHGTEEEKAKPQQSLPDDSQRSDTTSQSQQRQDDQAPR